MSVTSTVISTSILMLLRPDLPRCTGQAFALCPALRAGSDFLDNLRICPRYTVWGRSSINPGNMRQIRTASIFTEFI